MKLRVAIAQFCPKTDISTIVSLAVKENADVLVFPEMWSNGYPAIGSASKRAEWLAGSQNLDSEYLRSFSQLALENGIAILTTFLETGDPKPFNAAVLFDRYGENILHQRKRFPCYFASSESGCESGQSSKTCSLSTKSGEIVIGIMICMDREFPIVGTDLANKGVEDVLVPNSCDLVKDPIIGDVRTAGIRSRAFENVFAMAVANYPNPKNDGHSVIVDGFGKILAQSDNKAELLVADIDIAQLRKTIREDAFRRTMGHH